MSNYIKITQQIAQLEMKLYKKFPELDRVGIIIDEEVDSLFVTDLYIKVQHQGQGVGSMVMKDIFLFADSINYPVVLVPESDSDDPKKQKQLVKFYKKLGFSINKGKSANERLRIPDFDSMYRLPVKLAVAA